MDARRRSELTEDSLSDEAPVERDPSEAETADADAPQPQPQFSLRELFIFEAIAACLLAVPLIRNWLIGAVGFLLLLLAVPVFFQCLLFAAMKLAGWLPERPSDGAPPCRDWATDFHR